MIEKRTKPGPHVVWVEERVNKRTRKPLPAKQTLCHRQPANHVHEVYACRHGERTWCIGATRPQRSEIEETLQARFGCTCTFDTAPVVPVLHSR